MRDDVIAAYRVALEREIALVAPTLPGPVRIARLHWGGGTPSILGVEGLASVMQVLRGPFRFSKPASNTPSNSIRRYVTP